MRSQTRYASKGLQSIAQMKHWKDKQNKNDGKVAKRLAAVERTVVALTASDESLHMERVDLNYLELILCKVADMRDKYAQHKMSTGE